MHVGDILLSVNGNPVTRMSAEEATRMVSSGGGGDRISEVDHYSCEVLQLEILPGIFSRSQSSLMR